MDKLWQGYARTAGHYLAIQTAIDAGLADGRYTRHRLLAQLIVQKYGPTYAGQQARRLARKARFWTRVFPWWPLSAGARTSWAERAAQVARCRSDRLVYPDVNVGDPPEVRSAKILGALRANGANLSGSGLTPEDVEDKLRRSLR